MSQTKKRRFVPSVQQLAGSPGPSFEAVGKRWRLGFNEQNAKGALEELIRAHHARKALKDKRLIGGDEGNEIWAEFSRLSAEGFYETFGPGWIATMKSPDGILLFLQSLLLKNHPDVTAAQVEEMFGEEPEQVMAAVEVVAPDFFAAVAVQKGYSTADAKAAAPEIASAIREQLEAARGRLQPTSGATPAAPATPSTAVPA